MCFTDTQLDCRMPDISGLSHFVTPSPISPTTFGQQYQIVFHSWLMTIRLLELSTLALLHSAVSRCVCHAILRYLDFQYLQLASINHQSEYTVHVYHRTSDIHSSQWNPFQDKYSFTWKPEYSSTWLNTQELNSDLSPSSHQLGFIHPIYTANI